MTSTHFTCEQCGNCCRPTGYVRLGAGEVDTLAAFLKLPVPSFTNSYTRVTGDRHHLSLKERPNGSCVFLQPDNTCLVHNVKPRQCREFPITWSFAGYERICEARRPPIARKALT